MADIDITSDSELMVAQVEAQNDTAAEFIDAFVPAREGAEYTVVDSGRLIVHTDDVDAFIEAAQKSGLTTEHV